MHSGIAMTHVNVLPFGMGMTVDHTPIQDIAMLYVMETALALMPLTVYNVYLMLIVMVIKHVFVILTGPEMTVADVITYPHVILFVTIVMAVQAQLEKTVMSA